MSVDLMCRLAKAVSVPDVEVAAGRVLARLLGLTDEPRIVARPRHRGGHASLAPDAHEQLLFSIEGEPEVVAVGVARVEDEARVYFNVSACRSSVEYALAAALAIATANLLDEDVIDDAQFYTNSLKQRPDQLLTLISVAGSATELRLAADALYERLYKAGWKRPVG